MQIYNATGVATTGTLILNKGVGALLIGSSLEFNALVLEKISVFVERAGKNTNIVQDMFLKDFMLLASVAEDTILPAGTLACTAMCELTEDGGYIQLSENETIKIVLTGLTPAATYAIYGIEEPVGSNEVLLYETKVMASAILNQDFDTVGYDVLVMTKDASLSEISLTYDNGNVVKLLPIELEALQKSIDPMQIVTAGGLVLYNTTRYQIPLKGITNVNIRKTAGVDHYINLRIDESDFQLYQLPNLKR